MLHFNDPNLFPINEKIIQHKRLDLKDGLTLFNSRDILGIGQMADYERKQRHDNKAYYVYNQHINYTNVCKNRCVFCAFARDENQTGCFTLSNEDVKKQISDRIHEPITEIHVVGGINPKLGADYYINLLKTIKLLKPNACIKAFTAVEIDHIAKISGNNLNDTISELKNAGLGMVPGGGAEILSDRIFQALFPKKINRSRWLEVTQAIHEQNIPSNATMLYGHIETLEERVEHLIQLRELQDKTKKFSAFIPLAFQPKNTGLSHLASTTGVDDLKTIAISRLMLDNFDHIKAYWVMISEKLAQVALSFGADDLDGTIIEEKIGHMAGAKSAKGLSRDEMIRLISSAGFVPVQRDSFYNNYNNCNI